MDAKRKREKKRHGGEVCVLEPDDFPDDFPEEPDPEELEGSEVKNETKGGEFFRLNDISYFLEKKRKGYEPIKGRKF